VEKLKKHFNLWVVLSLPILVLITNQIHVAFSLALLGGAYVGLGISYDQISFQYDEKKYLNKR
jgi:hypothetical protein